LEQVMVTPLSLPSFTWSRYEVVLAVDEPLLLPLHKGATLRGSFGQTLKRLACFHDSAICDARPPACSCPYGFLFAPRIPEGCPRFRAGEEIARPFVIEPPRDEKRQYRPGETVVFNLLLFGKATEHLPWFLVTFRELPSIGIPPHRGRVTLQEVWAVDDLSGVKQRVYSAADQLVKTSGLSLSWEALTATASRYPTDRLTLRFLESTHLRYLSRSVRQIEFPILVSRLLQRVETLAGLYGDPSGVGAGWSEAARALIQAAREVTILRDETTWDAWKRFSTRQQQEVPVEGVVGAITYAGDLAPFLPLLLVGQYTHVGKGCVFGLGRYEVLAEE